MDPVDELLFLDLRKPDLKWPPFNFGRHVRGLFNFLVLDSELRSTRSSLVVERDEGP